MLFGLIKPRKKITPQEALNINWQRFIVEQEGPGYNGLCCQFVTEDGNRCALGWLVPGRVAEGLPIIRRDLYTRQMNCRNWIIKNVEGFEAGALDPIWASRLRDCHNNLIDVLKHAGKVNRDGQIEDKKLWTFGMKEALTQFAKDFNLTIPN